MFDEASSLIWTSNVDATITSQTAQEI